MVNWDLRFIDLAAHISTWSKDPSTQVGAVIVNKDRIVVGMGYNGFPRGVLDLPERYTDRDTKYKMIVHAEVNAILQAGQLAKGATLYVYPSFAEPPICNECCKFAIQAGIKEIVGLKSHKDDERNKRWADSIAISKLMCLEAGVLWRMI